MNILNLPDWTIVRTVEGKREYEFTATYDVAAVACTSCWRFGFLQPFGKRSRLFLDLPMHGKRDGIHEERPPYVSPPSSAGDDPRVRPPSAAVQAGPIRSDATGSLE